MCVCVCVDVGGYDMSKTTIVCVCGWVVLCGRLSICRWVAVYGGV